jgi:hypothetical protein
MNLKFSNADPPQSALAEVLRRQDQEALEKGVPPRYDWICLVRALAPSGAQT